MVGSSETLLSLWILLCSLFPSSDPHPLSPRWSFFMLLDGFSIFTFYAADNNVARTDKSELVNASSDRHKDCHSEMLMSPSETGKFNY